MWSMDGEKLSENPEPYRFARNERVRLRLINDTMMTHPMHLHGHFFEIVNGNPGHQPLKHTVRVLPGGFIDLDLTADAPGDWAFHCHLLYHMHAGMMRVVSVRPLEGARHEEHSSSCSLDGLATPAFAQHHAGHKCRPSSTDPTPGIKPARTRTAPRSGRLPAAGTRCPASRRPIRTQVTRCQPSRQTELPTPCGPPDAGPTGSAARDPHAGHDMGAMAGPEIRAGAASARGARRAKTCRRRLLGHGDGCSEAATSSARSMAALPAYKFFIDRAETRIRDGRDGYLLDAQAWYGGDIDKLWLKSEVEGGWGKKPEHAEVQALWSHAIGPWFDLQAGVRFDPQPGPNRTHLVLGVQGLAPYWWEVEGSRCSCRTRAMSRRGRRRNMICASHRS